MCCKWFDTIVGGTGADYIYAGIGTDTIDGGAGTDYLSISNYYDTASTSISYTSIGTGTIGGGFNNGTTFKSIELFSLVTGSGSDYINISAATGSSYVSSGAGNDTIFGGTGSDSLYAGDGDDLLAGGAGNDFLTGGAGNNIFNGGTGNDTLTGGVGTDTFVFSGNSLLSLASAIGVDTITNFTVGTDKLQLSKSYFSLFASTASNTLAATDFSTVTTDTAAAIASSAVIYNSTNGKLFYNVDGSTTGFGISGGQFAQLNTGLSLAATDFITNTI